jgi:hypothetical protein
LFAVIGPARISRLLFVLLFAALVSAILLPRAGAADELEQSLRPRYGNKTVVLRGFYHGDKLKYDSAGMLAGNLGFGDWTVDGVVHITSINVSDRRLTIHADRLRLIYDGHALAFQTSGNKKPKRTSLLRIEAELDAGAATSEKGQALLAKIFLTPPDRLADIVPDYWKSCVLAASENLGKELQALSFQPKRVNCITRARLPSGWWWIPMGSLETSELRSPWGWVWIGRP